MPCQDLVPDLLHPVPLELEGADLAATRVAVGFAFASGVSGGLFADALERAPLAPSTWEPSAFASDLFLQTFVAQCFKVRAAGNQDAKVSAAHLTRLLAYPPSDPAIVQHRRAILAELSRVPALRRELAELHALLCRFRILLEGAAGMQRFGAHRRQLDVLSAVRELLDHLADGFRESRSGLRVLTAFGDRIRGSEPFRSLCDLIRYDQNLASVKLDVGVGADGSIRGLRIVSVVEDQANPFVTSPLRRWLAKLELFARGYRFGDGEVMARLIDAVFEGLEPEIVHFVKLLGDVEFYLGALGFQDVVRAAGLSVCLPEIVEPGAPRELRGLFNPLLLPLGAKVVPCDVSLESHASTTLVTGPNSGGKTRLLQSLGLTQLLAQAGVFVPARSGQLALAPALVMSLIQETRADQAEGRLGMELVRIRSLFERLPPGAMVILDELCSGTNPSEGEEIFELVVAMLTRLEPQAFITTHFLAFAARLEQERKIDAVRFLQVELGADQEPTYQFVPGVARTSLAGHAAARLGVTGDQLLALVERNIALALARAHSGSGSGSGG